MMPRRVGGWAVLLVGLSVSLSVSPSPLAAQDERRVAAPFFQLRVENPRLFTESRYAGLLAALADLSARRLGVRGDPSAELGKVRERLAWPLEITVLLDRATSLPLVGIWTPVEGAPLLDLLLPLSGGEVGERGRLEDGGTEIDHLVLAMPGGALRACQAADGARRLLLLGRVDSVGEPAAALQRFRRSAERVGPAKRTLEKHARGGDIGWVFNFHSLVASADHREIGATEALIRLVLGPQFAGIAGTMTAVNGSIDIDLFADLRPGRGWVGGLLHREPRELTLAGWIPDGVTDFVALDPSVDGAVRLCHSLQMFGEEITPGDLRSELAWLDVDLQDFLDTHFDGQVIAVSELGIETQFEHLENLEGFVVGFGAFDGPRLLAATRDVVNAADDVEAHIEETPAMGPGVHTLTWNGEPHLHLAATPRAVFVSGADPAGAALLRKCLATGGRGPHPRSANGSPRNRVATMIGRGHILRHVMEIVGDGGHREGGGGFAGAVRAFLKEHDGVAEWRLVVQRDGTRLHVRL